MQEESWDDIKKRMQGLDHFLKQRRYPALGSLQNNWPSAASSAGHE
ncbi:MAG TPA: hypothetical protein PLO23_04520 [Alphaproteobacteria bacterium]|nr:hypothetical protein [Alphaproteobacteria bacterium]